MLRTNEFESRIHNQSSITEPAPLLDRWVEGEMFEEDLRAVLRMMRPHSRERLKGWKEYRTGGRHFRITVSWDDEFQLNAVDEPNLAVPHMADVIETLLIGSANDQDDLTAEEEFHRYSAVLREVFQRLQELRALSD